MNHVEPQTEQSQFIFDTVQDARDKMRWAIVGFFLANLGVKVASRDLHYRFGSGFRSRVSEINRQPEKYRVAIHNVIDTKLNGIEKSWYWGEKR